MDRLAAMRANADFALVDNQQQRYIKLIELPKLWRINDLLLLLPTQRVVMTEDHLRSFLKDQKEKPSFDVNEEVDNAISVHNFENTKMTEYQALMEEYQKWIIETYQSLMEEEGESFESLILIKMSVPLRSRVTKIDKPLIESTEDVGDLELVVERHAEVPTRTIKKTIKRPKKQIDFKTKLKEVTEDKIINITDIDKYGGGYKTIPIYKAKYWFKTKDERVATQNYKSLLIFNDLVEGRYDKEIDRAKKHFKIDQDSSEENIKEVTK